MPAPATSTISTGIAAPPGRPLYTTLPRWPLRYPSILCPGVRSKGGQGALIVRAGLEGVQRERRQVNHCEHSCGSRRATPHQTRSGRGSLRCETGSTAIPVVGEAIVWDCSPMTVLDECASELLRECAIRHPAAAFGTAESYNRTDILSLMLQAAPAKRGQQLPHWFYLALLTAFSFALYWEIFTYNTFGPETPLFFMSNDLAALPANDRSPIPT